MGFIKNNATTLKQVKIGTDTSKIHYIKRNGSIEWAKPYNLTITKGSNVSTLSVYRDKTKVSSGVTSGSSATLASGNQVFHGDVLHVDATPATGYHITSGTGDIKVEGNAIDQVKGTVTINPQVDRNQYTFRFEPRLIETASSEDESVGDGKYSVITDTSLSLTMPFGYDDDIQPTDVNTTISAVSGSMTVRYNGYLLFPPFFSVDTPLNNYYPEVKETNRLMYKFFTYDQSLIDNELKDRIGASDKTVAAYFRKFVGTILTSHSPIPMIIDSSPYNLCPVGSTESFDFDEATLESGGSVVLWSDIINSGLNKRSGTSYTCEIPSDQEKAWTFDSTGKTSVLKKEVTLASWTAENGFTDSDIPVSAEIPTPTKRRYKVAINVESSKNSVILDNADVKTGRLFYCINDNEWHTFSGSASASLELPYGTTIKLAKGSGYNMTGFTYNSDTVSETKTITVNGTNYAVDVYSKSYTVNANNMNIPFYVTPNSYTITCNIGMGISSFNFSTTSKYATSLSKQSYSSNKSFTVYYKDTCSYNGMLKTGFENATPAASNETVSTKTITFTASPKKFRVTVSTLGGITATFNRTSSPYGGAATGNLTSGYDANGNPIGVGASKDALTFVNGMAFDAYYGDVLQCDPHYFLPLGIYRRRKHRC